MKYSFSSYTFNFLHPPSMGEQKNNNIDKSKIETCYMNLFQEHKYKPKTKNEMICFLNLRDLKNGICKCIEFLTENICKCVYCKDKYDVKNLDKHECKIKLYNYIILKTEYHIVL